MNKSGKKKIRFDAFQNLKLIDEGYRQENADL